MKPRDSPQTLKTPRTIIELPPPLRHYAGLQFAHNAIYSYLSIGNPTINSLLTVLRVLQDRGTEFDLKGPSELVFQTPFDGEFLIFAIYNDIPISGYATVDQIH